MSSPSPAIAFGMIGTPSHSLAGFPDGIFRTGAEGVSVGGTGVAVGVWIGVFVGSGVLVEVGKLVSVGADVAVGFGASGLQDASATTRAKSNIVLLMIFIYSSLMYSRLMLEIIALLSAWEYPKLVSLVCQSLVSVCHPERTVSGQFEPTDSNCPGAPQANDITLCF